MMQPLVKLAHQPASVVDENAMVREAVGVMVKAGLGAVSVLRECKLVGVFTERDLMMKVVHHGLDPATTPVHTVMAAPPICVKPTTSRNEAIEIMLRNRFRHLPISDDDGCLVGMLSLRELLGHQLTRLREEVLSLESYLLADGPGG